MVSGPFYIYGGGRWREVNLEDASIEGWGWATLAYIKHSKLITAKTSTVLAALRNLKAGIKSSATDGALLPHSINPPHKGDTNACDTHFNNRTPPNKAVKKSPVKLTFVKQSVQKVDTAIQTTPPHNYDSSKTKKKSDNKHNESMSSEENVQKNKTIKKKNYKKSNETESSDENEPRRITTTAIVNPTPQRLAKLRLKKQWSLAGSYEVAPKKLKTLKLHKEDSTKYNLYKRKRSGSGDSLVWVVMPKTNENKQNITYDGKEYVKSNSKEYVTTNDRRHERTNSETSQEARPQKRKMPKSQSQTDNVSSARSNYVEKKNHSPSKKQKSSNDNAPSKSPPMSNLEKAYLASQNKLKELFIDEDDILLLRDFLMNNAIDFDLLKFDEDCEYRTQFLHAINPVVNLVRCPKIDRMLFGGSQSEKSLKDFASQLGLTSVSEKNEPQQYKTRGRNFNRDTNRMKQQSTPIRRGRYWTDTETDSDFEGETRSRSDVAQEPKRYKTRKSVVETKINRKNDERSTKTTKSDEDYSDRDSVEENDNMKVLRKRITSRGDLRKSDREDSDWVPEIEQGDKNQNMSSEQINTDTNTEVESTEEKSKKEATNNNSSFISDNVNTIISIKRNNKGRFVKKIRNNSSNVSNKEDSIAGDKSKNKFNGNSKNIPSGSENSDGEFASNKHVKNTRHDKLNESNDNNSEEQFKSNKETKTTRKNKLNKSINKNVTSEQKSFEKFISDKVAKITKPNKLNESMSESVINDKNSDEESTSNKTSKKARKNDKESQHKMKNKIIDVKNTNDRNNNMTDTNDDSDVENKQLKSDPKMKNNQNKVINKENASAGKLNLVDANESDNSGKPIIGEVKSLAFEAKTNPMRPASVASSLQRVEYSNLEDHAIVAWLSAGGRARCVNGNRIWKELQEQYHNIAGQYRSWHSLRNRYLRSILPRLGQLALNPSLVTRLRAAAHTGELKKAHKVQSRNSIFGVPPLPGAMSRRPRAQRSPSTEEEPPVKKHKHDHTRKPHSSPDRRLRPRRSALDDAEPTPRFSDITRRFAAKQRASTPDSSAASPDRRTTRQNISHSSPDRRLRPRSSALDDAEPTPRFFDITRRFAAKQRASTPDSSTASPDRKTTRQNIKNLEKNNLKTIKMKARTDLAIALSEAANSLENLRSRNTTSNVSETRHSSRNLSENRNSSKNLLEPRSTSRNISETRDTSKNMSETANSSKDLSDAADSSNDLLEARTMSKKLSVTKNSSRNLSLTRNSSKNLPKSKIPSKDTASDSDRKVSEKSLASKVFSVAKSRTKTPGIGEKRTRKLFNPNSML